MAKKQQNSEKPQEMGESSGKNEAIIHANIEPKSITNIHYDCLERIFDFLDLESLLNLANTCKRLQIAAAANFGEVHGETRIGLYFDSYYEEGIHLFYSSIRVIGLKFNLRILRCFGTKVSHLLIYHASSKFEYNEHLRHYINQYCANSLKSILFWSNSDWFMKNVTVPFKMIENVAYFLAELGAQLHKFSECFPNLRTLDIYDVAVDGVATGIQFQHLEHLIISSGHRNFGTESIMNLLHGCPKLQTLNIDMDQDTTLNELLNMINENPLITKLTMYNKGPAKYVNQNDLIRLASERPSMIELNLPSHRIALGDLIILIRQLESLKAFQFVFNDDSEYEQLVSRSDSQWKHDYKYTRGALMVVKLKREN